MMAMAFSDRDGFCLECLGNCWFADLVWPAFAMIDGNGICWFADRVWPDFA